MGMTGLTKEAFSRFENIEHLSQFLHSCAISFPNETCLESERNVDSDTQQTSRELQTLSKHIQNWYRQQALDENVSLPVELPQSAATALETVFNIRRSDIVNSLVKEKLINSGYNITESFDWKLKWVLGSSKLASIREPICQVELSCVSLGKDLKPCRTSVHFECDLEKVDKLISVLNSVKSDFSTDPDGP